jgi:fumarate hydratase class II
MMLVESRCLKTNRCINKIANDIRMLASGPRSGIGEKGYLKMSPLFCHARKSSSQCEALTMVCASNEMM